MKTEDDKDQNIESLLENFKKNEDNYMQRQKKFGQEQQDENTEDTEKRRLEEKEEKEKELFEIEAKIRNLESESQMHQTEILQLKGQYQKNFLEQLEEIKTKVNEKIETFELLNNPEENENKLKELIEKTKERNKGNTI